MVGVDSGAIFQYPYGYWRSFDFCGEASVCALRLSTDRLLTIQACLMFTKNVQPFLLVAVLLFLGAGCQTTPAETVKRNAPAEEAVAGAMNNPTATLKTNKGEIVLELFSKDAPKTVENFLSLASSDFYDKTLFHRVIPDFMVQGGDPNSKSGNRATYGTGGPGYTFEDEINANKIVRGVLAMANAGSDTNGSQFFIVTAESTLWLDGKHTVFGRVMSGMDVVDAIEKRPQTKAMCQWKTLLLKT